MRVHDGPRANLAAKAIGARAFTHGPDIGFAKQRFQPATVAGRRLLAHELAHTIQQGAVGPELSPAPLEAFSPRLAEIPSPGAVPLGTLQRAPESEPSAEPSPEGDAELEEARRHTGGLKRWAERVTRKAIDRWIRRLEADKIIAFPRLRLRRARQVLLLVGEAGATTADGDAGEALALSAEAIAKLERLRDLLSERADANEGAPEQAETGPDAASEAEAESEPESGQAETQEEAAEPCADFAFLDSTPAKDLVWDDFDTVAPGSLDPADAQVGPQIITHDANQRFAALLPDGAAKVERGAQSPDLLEHEQVHWRITSRIVQLANTEVQNGGDYAAVFRVATHVHELINKHTDGLYDRDTLIPDAIPKYDWPSEWCSVVDENWEKAVKDAGIRTITIEPLP